MADWPVDLPQSPLREGFKDVPQDSVLRSQFDGYSKQRSRFTASIHNVSETYSLTIAQYQIFRDWWKSGIKNGSLEFLKPDPIEGITRIYKMAAPYDTEVVGLGFHVTLEMEKMP